jgi:hypothetical protein
MVDFSFNLLVPESNYPITLLVEMGCPPGVFLLMMRFGMLASIEFDNQAPLDATKVSEIRTDLVLPAEFEAIKTSGSEVPPQFPFLRGGVDTQPPASVLRAFITGIHQWASKVC